MYPSVERVSVSISRSVLEITFFEVGYRKKLVIGDAYIYIAASGCVYRMRLATDALPWSFIRLTNLRAAFGPRT